ncbi:hypothetical protein F0562_019276 [Nyssa sinensis]|uniref:Uncharacterized protein n=1 Tax=Nyssa sinensis TaxID=561372 RepID=A0A5J4ZFV1_9ASTE|nr:hypothetical protein F0562_019276 [Nyssa sinensis]
MSSMSSVFNNGSSIVQTRRRKIVLCASRRVPVPMPVGYISSQLEIRTIQISLRNHLPPEKIPKNCVERSRNWRGRYWDSVLLWSVKRKISNEINEELCFFKEHAKKEAALKNEASRQKASIQQLLHLKAEELDKSTLECMRLQERNIALAKELAALKLVSDSNLEEEEVLKLASLGNEANNKDTIDILKKSLVIRNKSYKELMVKCNILGRGEARSLNKLEKAEEKIKKLKTRVQELETAVEVKDNEVLRAMKASKKTTREGDKPDGVNLNSNSSSKNRCSLEYQMEEATVPKINLDQIVTVANDLFSSRKTKKFKHSKDLGTSNTQDDTITGEMGSYFMIDEDSSEISKSMHELPHPDLKHQTSEDVAVQRDYLSGPESDSDTKKKALAHGPSNKDGVSHSRSDSKGDMANTASAAMEEDVVLVLDDIKQSQPLFHVKKETPSLVPISQPGDHCFSAGLLGPDGTKRHLGKWCKRVQNKESTTPSLAMQRSSTSIGDLVAIGADGRGGRIKVLRSMNQSSMDGKDTSTWAKRCKYGSKTSSLQSQGCLQIEHFFARANQ